MKDRLQMMSTEWTVFCLGDSCVTVLGSGTAGLVDHDGPTFFSIWTLNLDPRILPVVTPDF